MDHILWKKAVLKCADGPITDEASLEAYSFLIECLKKYGKYA